MNQQSTIFLDSEETIYENLKQNDSFTLNSSSYLYGKNPNSITHRIQDAEKRLESIEKCSRSKKKSVNTGNKNLGYASRGKKNQMIDKNGNFSISQIKTVKTNKKKICSRHECEYCGKIINDEDCDQGLLEKIKKLSLQMKNRQTVIEDLEDKIVSLQVENVKKQQKFLNEEKKYIIEINKLKKMLEQNEHREWQMECEKAELFDQLSEAQHKAAELEEKLMDIGDEKLFWKKKDSALTNLRKKYVQSLQKKQASIEPINQNNNEGINLLKEFIRNLKNIMETGETNGKFFNDKKRVVQSVKVSDKENQPLIRGIGATMRKTIQPLYNITAPMTESYCITEMQEENLGNCGTEQSEQILPPLSLMRGGGSGGYEQEKVNQQVEQFYRMMFVQAETIEKLGIL